VCRLIFWQTGTFRRRILTQFSGKLEVDHNSVSSDILANTFRRRILPPFSGKLEVDHKSVSSDILANRYISEENSDSIFREIRSGPQQCVV